MFRIKICGVRFKQDVLAASDAGADAIGLNFFPPSIRYVDPDSETTLELSQTAVSSGLLRVGVFVNESPERIETIADHVGLDVIQLHGDESTFAAKQLIESGRPLIRAIKLPTTELASNEIDQLAHPWAEIGCHLLLDADAGRAHGGSGKVLDWQSVARWASDHPEVHWTLAGGLRQENLSDAIARSGARSVDTASGVECPRSVKNHDRIAAFCRAAQQAFEA